MTATNLKNCPKVQHTGTGYLHGPNDDTPYDVDGVQYCGRCHMALSGCLSRSTRAAPPAPVEALPSVERYRFVDEARALHLHREWPDNDTVEQIAGHYVEAVAELRALRAGSKAQITQGE